MAKFKYCVDGSEPVIKDLKAVNDTYYDGEVLVVGAADSGGIRSAGAGIATAIIGVCNQDGTLPAASGYSEAGSTLGGGTGAVLAGTHALGTIDNLKVIINPGAVYAVEYDNSAQLTYLTSADTEFTWTCANGEGYDSDILSGGWVWSYNTGELDYCVDSSTSTTTATATTITGTDTTSTTGILIQAAGSGKSVLLELNANALTIDADQVDVGVSGTNAIPAVILENRIESLTQGSEILDPKVHNQQKRYMSSNTSYRDKAKIFAYARFNHVLSA